jgi:hypothetical protein
MRANLNKMSAKSIIGDSEMSYFIILFILMVSVFSLNCVLNGSIARPLNLAVELESPKSAPQDWQQQTRIPMKYRALFRWIVKGTWLSFLPNSGARGFYATYVFWSFVFFFSTAVALYYWLRMLDFGKLLSFLGCIIFLSSPPVALAYVYPVHTREDPLAYLLVILGMIAVLRSEVTAVILISILGSLTRETTLIVPFVYLFYTKETLPVRFLVCLVSVSTMIGIRFFLGYQSYNSLVEGWAFNLRRLPETILFLFMVYGVFWIPSLAGIYQRWKNRASLSYYWRILLSSTPACLGLILGTNLIFARIREIRIAFLSFPWIIPMALGWLEGNSSLLKQVVSKRYYWLSVVFMFLLFYFLCISLFELTNFGPYLGFFSSKLWRIAGYIHLSLTVVIVLPLLLERSFSLTDYR